MELLRQKGLCKYYFDRFCQLPFRVVGLVYTAPVSGILKVPYGLKLLSGFRNFAWEMDPGGLHLHFLEWELRSQMLCYFMSPFCLTAMWVSFFMNCLFPLSCFFFCWTVVHFSYLRALLIQRRIALCGMSCKDFSVVCHVCFDFAYSGFFSLTLFSP